MLMENDDDIYMANYKANVDDCIDHIFENYTLEEVLEMNDLDEKAVLYLLYTQGQIKEPEAYLP